MNELQELFKIAGDAGAVIVLALSAWGIAKVFEAIARVWGGVAAARTDVDAKRNEIDDKLAIAQVQAAAILDRLVSVGEATQTLIAAKSQESRLAHGTTQQYVERVEQAIKRAETVMGSAVERGDHQRKKIAEGVTGNGERLVEAIGLLKTVVAMLSDRDADKQIIETLLVIAQKLDSCMRARLEAQSAPPSGETVTDEQATKEA